MVQVQSNCGDVSSPWNWYGLEGVIFERQSLCYTEGMVRWKGKFVAYKQLPPNFWQNDKTCTFCQNL